MLQKLNSYSKYFSSDKIHSYPTGEYFAGVSVPYKETEDKLHIN